MGRGSQALPAFELATLVYSVANLVDCGGKCLPVAHLGGNPVRMSSDA
jgi:hypothetical protein